MHGRRLIFKVRNIVNQFPEIFAEGWDGLARSNRNRKASTREVQRGQGPLVRISLRLSASACLW